MAIRHVLVGNILYKWSGGHTVNIFRNGKEFDVFSFGGLLKE